MSALIGVCASDRVHIVADGITMRPDTGILDAIIHKYQILNNGAVVAGIGVWEVGRRFCELANARGITLDQMVCVAPELWKEARTAELADGYEDARCCAIFAGWSESCARLQLHLILGSGELYADVVAFAAGPTRSCDALVAPFVAKFKANPEAFDAVRDGIEMLQQMRNHHPRKFGSVERPAVGGHITHTAVTIAGATTKVIHRWPSDCAGKVIEISDTVEKLAPPPNGTEYEYVSEYGEAVWKDGRFMLRGKLSDRAIEILRRDRPDLAARYQRPVIGTGLPTAKEIDWLKGNPSLAHEWEKDFWPGASKYYLQGR